MDEKRIEIDFCNKCPFTHHDEIGIFEHSYCAFGLFIGGDWREFTTEELLAGMTEEQLLKLKFMVRPRRYPKVVPDWCPLRSGPVSITLKESL